MQRVSFKSVPENTKYTQQHVIEVEDVLPGQDDELLNGLGHIQDLPRCTLSGHAAGRSQN